MRKRVVIYLGILLGTILCCGGCGLFSKKVEFEDPLVERCVRMTLGKEEDETIREKDCAKLEKLLIDCDLDAGLTMDYNYFSGAASANYIDLCDLQYMTGLKELVIDNQVRRDLLVNIDAIENCIKLEELSLKYNPIEVNYFGMAPMGYKYMAGILSRLPKLEYLNLGYEVAEEHRELLAGDNDNLEFEDDFNGVAYTQVVELAQSRIIPVQDIDEYIEAWKYEEKELDLETVKQGNVVMEIEDEDQLEEFLDELPDNTEDICIYYKGTEDIDAELFTRFSELKTLSLIKQLQIAESVENAGVEVKKLNTLAENKYLFALNLSGIIFDEEELKEVTGLKELSLYECMFDNADFLECMPGLRELTVMGNYSKELQDYLEDNGEKMNSLKFLRVHCDKPSNYKGIEKYENLETLSILSQGAATSWKYIAQCPKLKYLSVEINEDALELEDLAETESLEYLFVANLTAVKEVSGVEEVIAMPAMRSFVLSATVSGQENTEAYYEEINDGIKAATDSETMSFFIPYGVILQDRFTTWNRENVYDILDLEKLYRKDILCGGYDRLMIKYPQKFPKMKAVREIYGNVTS